MAKTPQKVAAKAAEKSMEKPRQAVVEAQEDAGSVPAFLRRGPARGAETIRSEDLVIPRLDLMQDISPQVQDGSIEPGHFLHTVLEEDMGDEVEIIPIIIQTRFMLWRPRWQDGGGVLARADDGIHWVPPNGEFKVRPYKDAKKEVIWRTAPTVDQSGLALWGTSDPDDSDSPPAANKMVVVIGLMPEMPQSPVTVSMQRGSLTIGSKFASRLKFGAHDTFASKYLLKAERATNKEGQKFWVPKWVANGFVTEAQYQICESLYQRLQTKGFEIHREEDLQGKEETEKGKDYDKDM